VSAVSPFRRVLAGFDGSPDAADALRAAAAIVARDGGHVVALSVIRRPAHDDGDDSGGDGSRIRDLAEAVIGELRRDLPPGSAVRITAHVVCADGDSPAELVTAYAAEHGFDLLVLGRHGDGRRRRSRLGQVADRAIQSCPVPVLLLSPR
jgi:nucleotide-binding universal stress UspA family protein